MNLSEIISSARRDAYVKAGKQIPGSPIKVEFDLEWDVIVEQRGTDEDPRTVTLETEEQAKSNKVSSNVNLASLVKKINETLDGKPKKSAREAQNDLYKVFDAVCKLPEFKA